MHYVGESDTTLRLAAQTIYYLQTNLPLLKIHLMCLRLFYNALGGLYLCWAHFICSYISQEEFSVRLMGAIHSDWVTCRDKWAHVKRLRQWIISLSKQIPTFPLLFPSNKQHIYYSVNPCWFLSHHVFSSAEIDWPASWRQENGSNFSHQVMGRQDQYSHCWLSFATFTASALIDLSHIIVFIFKSNFFFIPSCQWHLEWLPVLRYNPLECVSKGHRFISISHLLSMSSSFYFSPLCYKRVEGVGPCCISI